MNKGLVHLYTGDGKGKTTAAVGLAVRMLGCGGRVLLCQFLKGRATGELDSLNKLGASIIRTSAIIKFTNQMSEAELNRCKQECLECFDAAREAMQSGKFNMVIMDEVVDAVNLGFIECTRLVDAVKNRTPLTEVIITGHGPEQAIIDIADYYSNIQNVKHPYYQGTAARQGIEY